MDMDKRLLDSLNNLSIALETISDTLKEKKSKSAVGAALESGDLSKNLKEISASVKTIKKDTQEILKNQKTILEISKKKESDKKTEPFESDPNKENSIKKGAATILLIAVAVLAIGLAFKLVGKVDFVSVIGLGLAIVLISVAFAKVAKLDLTIKQAAIASLCMVMMSAAIAASSWLLKTITPISFTQFLTAVFIGGMFVVLSYGMPKILKSIEHIKNPLDALKLVIILPAMALGIAASSWVLQLITPISWSQALTAIMIGAMFTVLSYSMEPIMKSIGKIKWSDIPKIPIFFTLMAAAIVAAAAIFSVGKEFLENITFMMMIKVLMLGAAMGVVTLIVSFALKTMGNISWGEVVKVPALFTLLALAITISALIVFMAQDAIKGIEFMTMIKLLVFSICLGASIIVMAFTMKVVTTLGGIGTYLKGSVSVIIIAAAIMISSWILSLGKYDKYPDWKWALGVGLSLLLFTPAVLVLGIVAATGIGALAIVLGAAMTLLVAASITGTSFILSKGKYDKYPTFDWIVGVGLSMTSFGLATLALGLIAITGIGALAILAGVEMTTLIAKSIVSSADILGKGKYDKYPSYSWAFGVGLVMTAFGFAVLTLGTFVVATFGLGWLALETGSKAVLMIADTIVKSADILRKGNYTGGPTKEWAEGISLSIGSFAPVYGMMMMSGIMKLFGGSGVSPDDFASAIRTISGGIVDAAGFFANNKSAFVNGPPKAWAEGVGLAIGAFSPVYKVLADNSGLFASGVSPKMMKSAIMTISEGIVDAAGFFAKNTSPFKEGTYPSKSWGEGVGAALSAFAPVFKALSEDTGMFTGGNEVLGNMVNGINWITKAIIISGANFASAEKKVGGKLWGSYPTEAWSKGVGTAIEAFTGIFSTLKGEVGDDIPEFFDNVTVGMVKISLAYDRLATAIKGFSNAIKGIDEVKIGLFKGLTGNLAILSALDSTMFNNMMNVLESRAGVFADLIKDNKIKTGSAPDVKTTGAAIHSSPSMKDGFQSKDAKGETALQKLDKVVALLSSINNEVKGLDEYLNKVNPNPDLGGSSAGLG